MHPNSKKILENLGYSLLTPVSKNNELKISNFNEFVQAKINFLLTSDSFPKSRINFLLLYNLFKSTYRFDVFKRLFEFSEFFHLIEYPEIVQALQDRCVEPVILRDLFNDITFDNIKVFS